jgi:hypothetical protein
VSDVLLWYASGVWQRLCDRRQVRARGAWKSDFNSPSPTGRVRRNSVWCERSNGSTSVATKPHVKPGERPLSGPRAARAKR